MVLRLLGDDDAVDQHARDLDLPRRETPALGQSFDLHDDDAARVARGHRDRLRLERERFAFHRHVAVGIGGGAAYDADVDRKRAVEQVLLAVDRHQRHEVLFGARVDLAAAVARVDEGAKSHARKLTGLARGDVPVQVRDHALRQVVRLDPVADGERLQLRHQAPVASDHALDEPVVPQMIEAALLAVPLPRRVHEREPARIADTVGRLPRRFEEALLQCDRNVLGEADADEAAGCNGVAVAYQCHRLAGCDDLAALERVQRLEQTMGVLLPGHASFPCQMSDINREAGPASIGSAGGQAARVKYGRVSNTDRANPPSVEVRLRLSTKSNSKTL